MNSAGLRILFEGFALGGRQVRADPVDANEHLSDIHHARTKRLARLRTGSHVPDTAPQRLVDQVVKASLAAS